MRLSRLIAFFVAIQWAQLGLGPTDAFAMYERESNYFRQTETEFVKKAQASLRNLDQFSFNLFQYSSLLTTVMPYGLNRYKPNSDDPGVSPLRAKLLVIAHEEAYLSNLLHAFESHESEIEMRLGRVRESIQSLDGFGDQFKSFERSLALNPNEIKRNLRERLKRVRQNMDNWVEWQVEALARAQLDTLLKHRQKLLFNQQIFEIKRIVQSAEVLFYDDLKDGELENASYILEGVRYIKSMIPVVTLGKVMDSSQLERLSIFSNWVEGKIEKFQTDLRYRKAISSKNIQRRSSKEDPVYHPVKDFNPKVLPEGNLPGGDKPIEGMHLGTRFDPKTGAKMDVVVWRDANGVEFKERILWSRPHIEFREVIVFRDLGRQIIADTPPKHAEKIIAEAVKEAVGEKVIPTHGESTFAASAPSGSPDKMRDSRENLERVKDLIEQTKAGAPPEEQPDLNRLKADVSRLKETQEKFKEHIERELTQTREVFNRVKGQTSDLANAPTGNPDSDLPAPPGPGERNHDRINEVTASLFDLGASLALGNVYSAAEFMFVLSTGQTFTGTQASTTTVALIGLGIIVPAMPAVAKFSTAVVTASKLMRASKTGLRAGTSGFQVVRGIVKVDKMGARKAFADVAKTDPDLALNLAAAVERGGAKIKKGTEMNEITKKALDVPDGHYIKAWDDDDLIFTVSDGDFLKDLKGFKIGKLDKPQGRFASPKHPSEFSSRRDYMNQMGLDDSLDIGDTIYTRGYASESQVFIGRTNRTRTTDGGGTQIFTEGNGLNNWIKE